MNKLGCSGESPFWSLIRSDEEAVISRSAQSFPTSRLGIKKLEKNEIKKLEHKEFLEDMDQIQSRIMAESEPEL